MDKNIIKDIIIRQQELVTTIPFVEREYELEDNANYVLVGLRRAGKTYLLYQHIHHLLHSGVKKEQILFVNFEDERINNITVGELHLILETYQDMFGLQPVIFLDELQNIEGWEHFARRLADEKYRVYITGSNAHMLSRDIASTLGGRYLMREVFPFSFSEYLHYNGLKLSKNWQFGKQRGDVRRLFDAYFYYGGLSESFSIKDKRNYLTGLYQKILLSDIVVRNGIRNERSLNLLVKRLADSVLQPSSINRLQNILSGAGQKITREKVDDFLDYLHDAYVTFYIANFTNEDGEREGTKKRYFYDNGILNLFLYQPETKLLENLVAIKLYETYGDRLFFYRRNIEVDFVIPDANTAVQVCYKVSEPQTFEREISALVSLNGYKKFERNILITLDEETSIERETCKIEVLPIWKWLLSPQPLP